MTNKTGFLDWNEIEKEIGEQNRKISDSVDTEAMKRKSAKEWERGLRLGWYDEDGNSLLVEETDEDDEEEE
jgi:hypothetical protein